MPNSPTEQARIVKTDCGWNLHEGISITSYSYLFDSAYPGIVDDLLRKYNKLRWSPRQEYKQVGREEIESFLRKRRGDTIGKNELALQSFVDDLLALFSQGSRPREWCVSHIRESHGKIELLDKDYFRVTPVTDEWQFCPICGAKRPEGGDGE